ncbi:HTH_Tnp_Tc3_2 domain-containing protein [Trichonephila clavipes]|nr:HTH_Tnp_Tc3_2 domain-containing protein [Trichonephila clavipes]
MSAYTKTGKTTSSKQNRGRMPKLANRDRRVLKRIVARKLKQSLSQITFEMDNHSQEPVSPKTVKREYHIANIYGRVAIHKTLVTESNAFKRCQWFKRSQSLVPTKLARVIMVIGIGIRFISD